MELSPAGFDQMLSDVMRMGQKTGFAYLRLLSYLRQFGSIPAGERSLCSIMGISRRYLTERAWPLLEDRLVLSADKGRYFDPDITRASSRTLARAVPTELSDVRRFAALSRHAKRDANGVQNPLQTDANQPANPASFAGDLQDFAPDPARAPSPSLYSSPGVDVPEEREEAGERGESQSARADAPANGLQNAAKADAKPPAKLDAKPHAQTTVPVDFQPPPHLVAEVVKAGYDPAILIRKFVSRYKSTGEMRADWDAAFEGFALKEPQFNPPPQPQRSMVMPIAGGKPDKGAYLDQERERIRAKMAAGNGVDHDDGPVIDGAVA